MLKVLGLIMLSGAVSSFGFVFAERLKRQKAFFGQLTVFARSCIGDMRCTRASIYKIFERYSSGELSFLKDIGKDTLTDPKELLPLIEKYGLESRDLQSVTEFFTLLGNGDLDSQSSHCEYFAESFHARQVVAEKELIEKGKLFKTLSILCGLGIFIIFI